MKMTSVSSSNIAAIGYDHDTREMHVEFHSGSTYAHHDVPAHEFEQFLNAPSAGSHYSRRFKDRFGVHKL